MKLNWRRIRAGVGAVLVTVASILTPWQTARAALPAVVLAAEAFEFAAAYSFRQIAARQVVTTIGVAANDASWATTGPWLQSGIAKILAIVGTVAGVAAVYEVPLAPGASTPPDATSSNQTGWGTGTATDPYTPNHPGYRFYFTQPRSTNHVASACYVRGEYSDDGLEHAVGAGPWTLAGFKSACAQAAAHINWTKLHQLYGNYDSNMSQPRDNGPSSPTMWPTNPNASPANSDAGDPELLPNGKYAWSIQFFSPYYEVYYYSDSVQVGEAPDHNKRLKISGDGYLPDEADPDWTPEEVAAFGGTPKALRVQGKQGEKSLAFQVSYSSSTQQTTLAEASVTQPATANTPGQLLYKELTIDANQQPYSYSQTVSEIAPGTTPALSEAIKPGASTSTGTNPSTSTFPNDYAKGSDIKTVKDAVWDLGSSFRNSENVGDPTAPAWADKWGDTFTALKGWQVPQHTSECPKPSFMWADKTWTFEAHCTLFDTYSGTLSTAMMAFWAICALLIVLRA